LTKLCGVVANREPPKLIMEKAELIERDPPAEYITFRICMKTRLEEIAQEAGIEPELLIWREPKDIRFEKLSPFVGISKAKDTRDEEVKQLVRIKEPSGSVSNLLEDTKSIIHHLAPLTMKIIRLYGVGINDEEAKQICEIVQRKMSEIGGM